MLRNIVAFIVSVAIAFIPSALGNLSSNSEWYDGLDKPPLNPPGAVFGPVWGALYFFTGVALFLLWRADAADKSRAYMLFAIQLVLNAGWTFVFFGLEQPWFALVVNLALLATIILSVIEFRRMSQWASWLFIPYALWVAFAIYLNAGVAILN